MQQTIKNTVSLSGIGLHTGNEVSITLKAAPVDSGINFVRTDITVSVPGENIIPARFDHVVDTQLCTVIANEFGLRVGTIEHLMAALRGKEIDNVTIEIDGAEVPVMDGSSAPFIKMIEDAGVIEQDVPRRLLKILKEVTFEEGDKKVTLSPSDKSTFYGVVNFDEPIGAQDAHVELLNGNFSHQIADARTFCFVEEVEAMRAAGLAQGGSLDNAVVFDRTQKKALNEGGTRGEDECARHKVLDAIGDLYLAGHQIIGAYEGEKAGHAMNNKLLHELFSTPGAYIFIAEQMPALISVSRHEDSEVVTA